jgi:LPXTG-motif cell wall-anchored protein
MKIYGDGNTAGAVQFDYDLPHLDLTSQALTLTVFPASSPPSSGPPATNPPAAGSTELTSNPAASASPIEATAGTTAATLPTTGINVDVLLITALGLLSLGALLVISVRTRRHYGTSGPT